MIPIVIFKQKLYQLNHHSGKYIFCQLKKQVEWEQEKAATHRFYKHFRFSGKEWVIFGILHLISQIVRLRQGCKNLPIVSKKFTYKQADANIARLF
jgi:hypothetical protein